MEKINIAELLKGCPKGMELDCTNYNGVVSLKRITNDNVYPIEIQVVCGNECNVHALTKYGQTVKTPYNKCIIFPKGKTTWEGFHKPFEDGDIIYTKHKLGTEFVSIFQIEYERDICTYWDINLSTNKLIGCLHDGNAFKVFIEKDKIKEQRFATEEEKAKLFQAFIDNGYRWNTETKALEELVNMEDKEINNFNVLPGLYKCVHRMFDGTPDGKLLFEVGNIYRCLSKHDRAEFEVSYGHSIYLEDPVVCKHFIPFGKQGEQKSDPCEKCNHIMLYCHNLPCSKKKAFNQGKPTLEAIREERVDNANNIEPNFKVGDKITNGKASITIGYIDDEYYYEVGRNIATRIWIKNQDEWNLIPNKFDISTLIPFESRVLVRDSSVGVWLPEFFACLCDSHECPYMIIGGTRWKCCIPFEGNEHLMGKADDCDDFYKNWQ